MPLEHLGIAAGFHRESLEFAIRLRLASRSLVPDAAARYEIAGTHTERKVRPSRSTRQFSVLMEGAGWLKQQSGGSRKMGRDTSNRAKGGFATRAIHVGHKPADELGALTPPVFMTSTYAFETAEAGEEIFRGKREGYVYGRTRNPTQALFEERIASLESAEAGLAVAIPAWRPSARPYGRCCRRETRWLSITPSMVTVLSYLCAG